jgi:hypothetical protein
VRPTPFAVLVDELPSFDGEPTTSEWDKDRALTALDVQAASFEALNRQRDGLRASCSGTS